MDWEKLERPYYLRSKKYEGGKYLSLTRKHEGVLEYINMALSKIDKNVIDFCDAGCGNGIYLNRLKNQYGNINLCGFDFAEKIVEIAKNNTKIEKIKIGNLENIPFEDESFDVILCTHVMEHLLDDKRGILELYRILRKDGYLIIGTDNKCNFVSKFLNFPVAILFSPYKAFKAVVKNKKYFPHQPYSIMEFKNLIKTQNFEIEKLSTFRFSMPFPLYKIKFMVNIINNFERFCNKIGALKSSGDVVIALCKKT